MLIKLKKKIFLIEKNKPKQLDPKTLLVEHNPAAPTPSSLIIQMKSDLISLLKPGPLPSGVIHQEEQLLPDLKKCPEETVLDLLDCIQHRSDLTTVGIHGIESLR